MTKPKTPKKTLPKGVLAQDEWAADIEEGKKITEVSLRIDFKVRGLECGVDTIVEDVITQIIDTFYDTLWVRAQVLEYKEV